MQKKTLKTCIFNTFLIKTTIQNHNLCIFKLLLQIKHIVNFKLSIKLKKNIIQIKHINKFRQIFNYYNLFFHQKSSSQFYHSIYHFKPYFSNSTKLKP